MCMHGDPKINIWGQLKVSIRNRVINDIGREQSRLNISSKTQSLTLRPNKTQVMGSIGWTGKRSKGGEVYTFNAVDN